jgi:hypothetical protein
MVGNRPDRYPLLGVRVERPLSQELVRGQAGAVSGGLGWLGRDMGRDVERDDALMIMTWSGDGVDGVVVEMISVSEQTT